MKFSMFLGIFLSVLFFTSISFGESFDKSKGTLSGEIPAEEEEPSPKTTIQGEENFVLPELGELQDKEESRKVFTKNPFKAGLLGVVFSGGGHFYIGENTKGALYSLNNLALGGLKFFRPKNFRQLSIKASLQVVSLNFIHGIQVYDSYSSALNSWGGTRVLKVKNHSLNALLKAPLKISNYGTWKVWAPLLLPAMMMVGGAMKPHPNFQWKEAAYKIPAIIAASYLVGVGEEALFRGYVQPAFAQLTGKRFLGNFLQALSFGSCHTRFGFCDTPMGTGHILSYASGRLSFQGRSNPVGSDDLEKFLFSTIFGFYTGYLNQSVDDGLLKAIALHSLWDTLVLTGGYFSGGNGFPIFLSFGGAF